jgi:uncharacterized protein
MNTSNDSPIAKRAGPIDAISACLVFSLIAFLINKFFHTESLFSILREGQLLPFQLIVGASIGIVYAFFSIVIFAVGGRYIGWLGKVWAQMLGLLDKIDLSGWNFMWFAISAGIGEELLFRGALQPIIGMWWSSLIFMLIHSWTGELSTMNWKKLVYIATTFVASIVLSYTYIYFGLIAAIVAHICIDMVAMLVMRKPQITR